MLPTSFTILLAFLNPLRSHRSLALQTLALAHRIRKIAQTPAPCRIQNKAVVSSYLRSKVKAVEEENEELRRHLEELQDELQTAKASFTAVSVALDQANEKGEKDSEELKKCREEIEAFQSAEQLRSLRIVTLE